MICDTGVHLQPQQIIHTPIGAKNGIAFKPASDQTLPRQQIWPRIEKLAQAPALRIEQVRRGVDGQQGLAQPTGLP